MNGTRPSYKKLSRRSLAWSGVGRLWLGEDHLLEVTSILFLESYRRYFFQEAMAFVVQRTKRRMAWTWATGGIGFASLLVTGLAGWIGAANSGEEWHIAFYVIAGLAGMVALVALILLTINLLLGPSCRCHVLTASGWHPLIAPTRLGQAQRVQAQITPLIEAAQSQRPEPETGIV